ncbi:hypothetical protein AC52_0678 [Escherichia coli 5-366-08_S3_C3]|nr:conserved hypothetical protein [Escherichia coli TA143]EZJ96838.1 hypothetical protein AB72_2950 [Escherichia coli 1-250-04_S1_C3]KDX29167.1 hypothetical protein AB41_2723 [Escherichia coli 1-250-04_S1_C2]KDX31017.1 hypothetical protein AB13_2460 [Escherichia coli 1-250-04_S1_C1]KEL77035.1 hypothetical protein AC52_0678 [Escherichia coli 5-366-08_S3_C3]KEL94369.1 hypothetical protein AB94_1020 [Escherichia coli 5-366-08_S3_C1]
MSVQTVFLPGLSPLARGTLVGVFTRRITLRFIPAGAGNTASVSACVSRCPVYPR